MATPLVHRLKRRRKKLGRSLRRAAEVSALSNPHICQIEGGDDASVVKISWLTFRRLCKVYDLEPVKLDAELERIAKKEGLL